MTWQSFECSHEGGGVTVGITSSIMIGTGVGIGRTFVAVGAGVADGSGALVAVSEDLSNSLKVVMYKALHINSE